MKYLLKKEDFILNDSRYVSNYEFEDENFKVKDSKKIIPCINSEKINKKFLYNYFNYYFHTLILNKK